MDKTNSTVFNDMEICVHDRSRFSSPESLAFTGGLKIKSFLINWFSRAFTAIVNGAFTRSRRSRVLFDTDSALAGLLSGNVDRTKQDGTGHSVWNVAVTGVSGALVEGSMWA